MIKTNNSGYGYHGEMAKKHDSYSKAEAEFGKMHTKVKKIVGEAGHLATSSTPNKLVRDYLDSRHGRHLADFVSQKNKTREDHEKYIKKDFAFFKSKYDPQLFREDTGFDMKTFGEFVAESTSADLPAA